MLVDSDAAYVHNNKKIIYCNNERYINIIIKKFINEGKNDDLKTNFVGVFPSIIYYDLLVFID